MTGAASAAVMSEFAKRLRLYRDDKVGFCREILGFDPHEGQQVWLENAIATENALTTGNRWGKSHIAGADLIHHAAYKVGWTPAIAAMMRAKHEPYHTINVSISADQAGLVWAKASAMLQNPKASWLVAKSVLSPFPRITLVNGAVIEARSTDNDGRRLLGNSYDFVNWDEAAYEKRFLHVRDNVLRMRLVDRAGTLNYTSTGNGRNDYGRYFLTGLPGEKRDPDLYSQTGSTLENPNVNHERIAKNMVRMSEKMRRQNISGEIIDAGGDFFDADVLADMVSDALSDLIVKRDDEDIEKFVMVREDGMAWREKYPSHRYLHAWDLADKADWTVGLTYDRTTTPFTLVEFERFQKTGWDFVYSRIRDRHHRYQTSGATKVDSTGLGDVIVNELKDINAEGVNFAGGRKDQLLENLQTRLAYREMRVPFIKVFQEEHTFYERDDENLVQDCVMANAIAAWFLKRESRTVYASLV